MSRDHIPAALQRDLIIEAGYRCAVCRTPDPLEFEHIEDYAKVQKHEFSNMIVLCSNCHARKSDKANPRRLDRKALKQIKMDLAVLNGRYSDLERRIIQEFAKAFEKLRAGQVPAVLIESTMYLLVKNLHEDGLVTLQEINGGIGVGTPHGTITNNKLQVSCTSKGAEFVQQLSVFKAI